jgi:ParB-like chromosome segregation protein Spo0J
MSDHTGQPTRVPLDKLVGVWDDGGLPGQSVQVRDWEDEATIEHYMACFDRLPPVVIFDTPEGYLLADGYHRATAASHLGHADILAEVRHGTRADAADYAATANATSALPLRPADRRRAIIGLHERHPDWTQQRIADAMSMSQQAVSKILAAQRVSSTVPDFTTCSKPSVAAAISSAPQEQWAPLAQAAQEQGWTVEQTHAAVQDAKVRVPEDTPPTTAQTGRPRTPDASTPRLVTISPMPGAPTTTQVRVRDTPWGDAEEAAAEKRAAKAGDLRGWEDAMDALAEMQKAMDCLQKAVKRFENWDLWSFIMRSSPVIMDKGRAVLADWRDYCNELLDKELPLPTADDMRQMRQWLRSQSPDVK